MNSAPGRFSQKNAAQPGGGGKGNNVMLHIAENKMEHNGTPPDREARALVQYKIATAQNLGRPVSEVMTITPAIARVLLTSNPADENRKLSARRVAAYASDIVAGRWDGLNGQTVVISREGLLNDGQHRLHAIVKTGVSLRMVVVWGVERSSRMTLDQNMLRSAGDYLSMSGMPYATTVAAVAALLHGYETGAIIRGSRGGVDTERRQTKAALREYAEKRQEQILRAIKSVDIKEASVVTSHSRIVAALCIIEDRAGFDAASEFIRKIVRGENLDGKNPALVARNRLLVERHAKTLIVHKALEIILRAWNAYRLGMPMARIHLKGNLPEVEA